jgi:hypothetical protein
MLAPLILLHKYWSGIFEMNFNANLKLNPNKTQNASEIPNATQFKQNA